ncbi:MerR family transcriptional regulator [Paucibacter sp. TC2R-5]|uniref:MerR family transcriptional regulator n=1 Tax=Paucibacter sp. TC2R-5 TaxID=2893555 RepID=UPI0021E4E922|nr:MerR family transcriptional regulator [Paucibacter sp. TC2R-5]MCV2359869.1 MerR family transcriptional regulator [Paucibacter sp. TC2R-5]
MKPSKSPEAAVRYRSGAVARMLRMPVATLRVWERRYRLTQVELSASGQRLYTAADVQHLSLLKRLSDLGHAIGSLAALSQQQLQDVAATHAGALADKQPARARLDGRASAAKRPSLRVAVIGKALAARLQSPALLRGLGRPVQWLGPFEDAAQAQAALAGQPVDLLLLQQARLHETWPSELQAAAPSLASLPMALLYRFASESHCEGLAGAGKALLREPQNDSTLGQWLGGVMNVMTGSLSGLAAAGPDGTREPLPEAGSQIPARRWDDAALNDFASLSSTVACECPRHVAELLLQLTHFEAYSAECEDRSPADAQLHRYLRCVAAEARASFEAALAHIAVHEGLILPPTRA